MLITGSRSRRPVDIVLGKDFARFSFRMRPLRPRMYKPTNERTTSALLDDYIILYDVIVFGRTKY